VFQYAFYVLPDLFIAVTNRRVSAQIVDLVANSILQAIMGLTIDLHDETLLRAEEIHDEIADHVLPTELVSAKPGATDVLPKLCFERGQVPAEALRSI
jgi:hypothetical protein